MTMSDKDRFHLQALMEKDPEAALAFHAERMSTSEPLAPIAMKVPIDHLPPTDFKKCGHMSEQRRRPMMPYVGAKPLPIPPSLPADYMILENGVLGASKDQALARDVLRQIKPIFERMRDDGSYAFGPSSQVNPAQVRLALHEATDRQVGRVILSRDSDIVPRQPWMNDKEHLMTSISALNGACDSYVGKLHDRITLVRDQRQPRAISPPNSMLQMEKLVRSSLGAFMDAPLSHLEICNSIARTLTMALSCVIDGDDMNAGRFIGLLEILPNALPFGKRRSDPESWIVRFGR